MPPGARAIRYFARVSAGLEQLAWQDIERQTNAELIGVGHRRIDFRYDGPPADLLNLRSVDDVYVFVARLQGLDRARASLGRISRQLEHTDFGPALAVIRDARALPPTPTYRVTESHLGKRNYSRYDVEGAVAGTLTEIATWTFVPNAPEEVEPDLDVRVLIEDDWALIGLRLGAIPLHRRAYKNASRPGSLKAPVAYCLCLLADLKPGDWLLDPACGAGTILAEATALIANGAAIGGDTDPAAITAAQENLVALNLNPQILSPAEVHQFSKQQPAAPNPTILLYTGSATNLPLADSTIQAVITNLPWGQQAPISGPIDQLYAAILSATARILSQGGHAVLLTDQAEAFEAAIATQQALRLDSQIQISLFGRHPIIYVLIKG